MPPMAVNPTNKGYPETGRTPDNKNVNPSRRYIQFINEISFSLNFLIPRKAPPSKAPIPQAASTKLI